MSQAFHLSSDISSINFISNPPMSCGCQWAMTKVLCLQDCDQGLKQERCAVQSGAQRDGKVASNEPVVRSLWDRWISCGILEASCEIRIGIRENFRSPNLWLALKSSFSQHQITFESLTVWHSLMVCAHEFLRGRLCTPTTHKGWELRDL